MCAVDIDSLLSRLFSLTADVSFMAEFDGILIYDSSSDSDYEVLDQNGEQAAGSFMLWRSACFCSPLLHAFACTACQEP